MGTSLDLGAVQPLDPFFRQISGLREKPDFRGTWRPRADVLHSASPP